MFGGALDGEVEAARRGIRLDRKALVAWLREEDPRRQAALFATADAVRRARVGSHTRFRGLVETGSHCWRSCLYCGLRARRRGLVRYRLTQEQILGAAHEALWRGCDTVVLQSGEDPAFDLAATCGVVRRIKAETGLAVTLSFGELDPTSLAALRDAGADRYLLKLETTSPHLYGRIHPPREADGWRSRAELLRTLRALGYEVGSGGMVGFPGQTWGDLADDLLAFAAHGLDMAGIGPWVAHPETPLGRHAARFAAPEGWQVPATVAVTQRAVALLRLLLPHAHLPATTAVEVVGGAGAQAEGLGRGANVVMLGLTPAPHRAGYDIYPNPARAAARAYAEA
ncbi:MAG: [FeFe] hydrogenase H-cluster radical SAM maturase HydE [Deltaproteobacteria bacterium]|nr:MAG: [FeFe] hydrogenase H-cluster radical SAM maturase HydE [Deltaproteobacteria bacterium]